MIREAARSFAAVAVTSVAIAYLLVRRRRARGHRDLKPGNVIRRPRTGPLR